jgi:signal transduction histidine kinase
MARDPSPMRPRGAILVAMLLLTLVLVAVLAYQAHEAARSHRSAVEATLEDYASFAAWEYRRRLDGSLRAAIHQALHPLFEAGSHSVVQPTLPGLDEFNAALDPEMGGCGGLDSADAYFRLDLGTGELVTNGLPIPGAVGAWAVDTLRAEAAAGRLPGAGREAIIFDEVEAGAWAAVYTAPGAGDAPATAIYGFLTRTSAFAPVCAESFLDYPLLPPSLTGGVANDSLLSITVTAGRTGTFCESPVQYASPFMAVDTLGLEAGRLVVEVALRPESAASLLIGGVPRSRLPVLLGLLFLTAGLIIAALVQLRREYELSRLREEFVSGVSHELRTPLAQIRMFAETLLLDRVRSDAERRRSMEIIDREARRLGQLVENVLRFSGSSRRPARLAPEPTALSPLVREVVEAFDPLARARDARVRIDMEPGVAAAVDHGAFRQILLNLLDNAVKYGPRGQTVTVTLVSAQGRARLSVDDEGPGVPRGERERIWASFSRLERDVSAAVAGSGIGLAVVHELTRLHGGWRWVEDSPAGGARFVVELPDAWRRLDDGDRTAEQVLATEGVA